MEFLAALLLSGAKNFQSVEFRGFPSTIDRARAFVSVSIDEWISTIKMHNQRDQLMHMRARVNMTPIVLE